MPLAWELTDALAAVAVMLATLQEQHEPIAMKASFITFAKKEEQMNVEAEERRPPETVRAVMNRPHCWRRTFIPSSLSKIEGSSRLRWSRFCSREHQFCCTVEAPPR